MSTIAQNIAEVREAMAAAAAKAGRAESEIQLLGATKMNDADRVREAIAAGLDLCGENRVQELLEKQAQNAYAGCPLHFIGHLQKNKAKFLVGNVDMIHSVDSLELMAVIDRLAAAKGVIQNILLEVNIGGEAAKSGVQPEAVDEMSARLEMFPNLCLHGFMTIPPIACKVGDNNKYFAKMYQLFVDMRAKKYDNNCIDCLSMGMSDDFPEAIQEGATLIRVGSRIFGARNYNI